MKTKLLVSSLFSLLISMSANAQWFQQSSGTVANLSGVHCADANTCMVSGTGNTARKTINGTSWNVTGTTGIANKMFVKMFSKDTIILGQDNGTFCRSIDGGVNWTTNIFGGNANFDLFDAAFISTLNWTAVGGNPGNQTAGGHITTSSINAGAAWPTFVNVSGEPIFYGIESLGANTFVACAGDESVYKTTDGGANWTAKLGGAPYTSTVSLFDINFPTSLIGYAVGGNSSAPTTGGVVYKTIDGGEIWLPVGTLSLLPNTLFGVHFVNKDTGYVVGDGGKIQVTKDGGTTWAAQISPVTTTLTKIHFPTSTTGYICGAGGVILKTSNGGFIAPLVVNAGADVSLCNGACTTLGGSSVASGGTTPYTYSWSPAAGTTNSIVVCPSVTTTYTLTVTDVNSNVSSDSVKVTIYTYPATSITGLNSPYCNMTSSDTLSGTPAGGVFTGPGIGTGGVFNAATAGAGTHTVTYTFTDAGTGCVLTHKEPVTVVASPTAVPLCLVTVDTANPATQNIVVWEKPVTTNIDSFRIYRKSGASAFSLIATVSYSVASKYVDAGVTPNTQAYTYALTTIDTCGIESVKSDSNTTMYLSAPAFSLPAKFDLSWSDYDGFTFSTYDIQRTVNNGTSWTTVGGVLFAAANTYNDGPTPLAPLNSRYRIRVTHPSSCNTGGDVFNYTFSNMTADFTSVNEMILNNWVKVYPNPNHGTFNVELSGTGFEVKGINVYNMLGEIVYQSAEKNKTAQISIPGIAPGVYHLEVITDSGTANKKITIE